MSNREAPNDSAAMPVPHVRTWDVLRSLGFEPDPSTMSDDLGALRKNFGNFTLSAIHCLTPRFANAVMLSGVLQTPRTLAEVECEMPQTLESRELGVAWVAWCLDNSAGGEFRPKVPTPWLAEGRAWRHLLPWERQRAEWDREQQEYAACPRCTAERTWARRAARALLDQIAAEPDERPVVFGFDGEVLTIRCGGQLIALAANGTRWPSAFSVRAGALRELPKRFKSDTVEVVVFRGALIVDGSRYPGAVAVPRDKDG